MKLSYDEGKVSRKNKLSGRMQLEQEQIARAGLWLFYEPHRGTADDLKNQLTHYI